jgi:hypothetical protein
MKMLKGPDGGYSIVLIGVYLSIIMGSLLVLAGSVAMLMGSGGSELAITIGAGLLGSSAVAKVVQTKMTTTQ